MIRLIASFFFFFSDPTNQLRSRQKELKELLQRNKLFERRKSVFRKITLHRTILGNNILLLREIE